jgi:flagellar assembly protein FliH
LSEAPLSYDFEPLEPSEPPLRDAAARMLAQATIDAEQIRESARVEGYEAGRATGYEHGASEISTAATALEEAARGVCGLRDEVAETVERDAIELALALAGKILSAALEVRPELVVDVVQGALRRISDRRRITVLVNPADLATVRASIGEITAQGSGVELCDLLADERVGAGSAVVRTAEGEVDASVPTQLERAGEVAFAALEVGEQAA